MRTMITILLWAVGAYVALIALMYVAQNWLLFHPTSAMMTTPDQYGFSYDEVELQTSDEESIQAWWIPAEMDRGTLLFFHGNAGNISGRMPSVRQFHELGLNVFIVSYRGYGESTGRPSEEGLYKDATAAYDYLTAERGLQPDELVIFGRSLGAGVASWVAHEHDVGALIMESPFTSVPDMAAHHYPWIPTRGLVRSDFDSKARMVEITAPVLVLHSPDDRVAPYELGRDLYETANHPKRFVQLRGGHNDGFSVSEPEYSDEIDAFLEDHGFPRR